MTRIQDLNRATFVWRTMVGRSASSGGVIMPKKRKPATGGQPATGLKRDAANDIVCLNPTTSPRLTQLFGMFDRDTKNAVILTAWEVSP